MREYMQIRYKWQTKRLANILLSSVFTLLDKQVHQYIVIQLTMYMYWACSKKDKLHAYACVCVCVCVNLT